MVAAWASTCPPAGFFGSDINIPPPGSAITETKNPVVMDSTSGPVVKLDTNLLPNDLCSRLVVLPQEKINN